MNCERQPDGSKVNEFGVYPAAQDTSSDGLNGGKNAGRICWAVAGTFCGGKNKAHLLKSSQLVCCVIFSNW